MSEQRKGYQNFTQTDLGQKGALRRDETNLMWNLDPYFQTAWQLSDKWSLDAGVRLSTISFDSDDHYLANGDDSGDKRYHQWLPAASLKYAIDDSWNTYLSAGKGFETPTITELSNRPDGKSGLNLG
ncbi:Outer membrane receptor for Fe3+-dicitrate [Tatumella ptyseos]|uniref:Outer membrane receptor for Fe3+-dicitrate n=2 Tax=Tatumella ptyseos TaxID=82987 RepID=A0A2X5P943_9GAMM|nr:Outer membrane receptor for Fe3+-dicitrate [Tatumella ptyseos]